MANKICLYTCITGNYDSLHEIEHPEKNVDYYCFTNNKSLKSKTWTIIPIANDNLDSCRLARKMKILGHPKLNQYDIAVWSDADVIWQKPVTEFVQKYFKNTDFSIFKHHARSSIHDEAISCLRSHKEDKHTIQKTLDFYDSIHYPDDNGLCESTVFIKNPHSPAVTKTMQEWFNIVKNYSRRDQLSFNYAAWHTKLSFSYIPLTVWENPWFYIAKHTPNQNISECSVYYGNPDHSFSFDKYFTYPYQIKNNTYRFTATIPNNTSEIEFDVSNITGAEYRNITIKPSPERTYAFESITINNQKSFFCSSRGIIRAYGNFRKNQKLSFSIEIYPPTDSTLNKIIEYQWAHMSTLASNYEAQILSLKNENSALNKELSKLRTNLNDVLTSKGWKTLEKLRKLIPSTHHK